MPRERTALITSAGSVTVIDAPFDSWPDELLIAGEQFVKTLYQAERGGPYRFVYTQGKWPLHPYIERKLFDALAKDDRAQRVIR